jgi:hypothetical protein
MVNQPKHVYIYIYLKSICMTNQTRLDVHGTKLYILLFLYILQPSWTHVHVSRDSSLSMNSPLERVPGYQPLCYVPSIEHPFMCFCEVYLHRYINNKCISCIIPNIPIIIIIKHPTETIVIPSSSEDFKHTFGP